MRDAERLVQVQVADVGAHHRRAGEADLRIHVGPVQIHLPAVSMDDGADFLHAVLEYAVR